MLPLATIQRIDRLLRDGKVSQRKIARQVGVSRGTVAAVASGRRGLYGKEPEDEASRSLAPQSPPKRCPGCGFLVYMPCLVCRARGHRRQRKMLRIKTAARGKTPTRHPARRPAAIRDQPFRRSRVA